jgi:hypothetical protein
MHNLEIREHSEGIFRFLWANQKGFENRPYFHDFRKISENYAATSCSAFKPLFYASEKATASFPAGVTSI